MTLVIVAVQSKINGGWGYGPKQALGLLHLEQDEFAPFATAEDALAAARRDKTIPADAKFEVASEGRRW